MIEFEGLEELNAKLKELADISEEVAAKELADIALDLGAKASDAAPIKDGDLRGELAEPRQLDKLSWQVGSSLPYTNRQHECTWYIHPLGGGAKFIETPFRENVDKYINEIGKQIKSALK